MTVIDTIIEKIESFNEANGLMNGNTETIYEEDIGITTIIEGSNNTTLSVVFGWDDIKEIETQNNFLEVVERNYKKRIADFDIDETFTELWSQSFAEHNGFTPRVFLNMLEDDKECFVNIDYSECA
ncbi:hypothetical protein [Mammaliicoccus lentus]|uniref:hypothetical protein n=1 Tax=Mammaliicoccus lentus TaxID=42858 RepID=UPI001072244A|nr:hypothetical protein [Mammaliicoccus lentus]MBF0795191.1 hypothetical protein [Mammaliicoccus lentus]TFV14592.1 hypothetical protein E4T78_11040 [Mammaliicoccus lentus]